MDRNIAIIGGKILKKYKYKFDFQLYRANQNYMTKVISSMGSKNFSYKKPEVMNYHNANFSLKVNSGHIR